MNLAGYNNTNTLIIEDSAAGLAAAFATGAKVLHVKKMEDLTTGYIENELYK